MKQILWCVCLAIFLIWPRFAQPQIPGNATIHPFPGVPTGNCSARQLAIDQSNGSLYTCINAGTGRQGTWQIIAGGGGGWNPPNNTPGDTLFGNGTVGTGTPSFFIPGGDVSFSSGNFSVNNLHFGPTSLALTNQGITNGNCLQVSGSNIIGGACGTGGGGAVLSVFGRTGAIVGQAGDYTVAEVTGAAPITSPTFLGTPSGPTAPLGTNSTQLATTAFVMANVGTNYMTGNGTANAIPRFTASTVLTNSLLTDDGTTLTYTGSGGIVAPSLSITQGAYELTSSQAALPALPGAAHNGFVSGPDGFYVSNNNSAWFKVEPPGTAGTGGAVSSVFGRTGAITASQGDYSFSQISGTLTAGQIGTAAVSSFNTRGGAVMPAAGDYTVQQVTGAAPLSSPALTGTPTATTPPTADDSTRIATTAWVKLQGYGTGGPGTGAVSSVFTRTGAVTAHLGDYDVSQVTGAAPLDSPQFTGVPVAPTAAAASNSNQVATTGFVAAAIAANQGGGVPAGSITRGPTVCAPKTTTTESSQTLTGLTINEGDTVVVAWSIPSASLGAASVVDNAVPASNVYTARAARSGTNQVHAQLWTTEPDAAHAATSVTIHPGYTGRSQMCVTTYTNVGGYGASQTNSTLNTGTLSLNVQPVDSTGVVIVVGAGNVGAQASLTFSASVGQLLGQATTTLGSVAVCDQFTVDPATPQCVMTATATGNMVVVGLELRPLAGGGGVTPTVHYPKVVAAKRATIIANAGVTNNDQFLFSCLATNCPSGGFYRVAWDFLGITGCTSGVAQVNIDYLDESSTTVRHTGMMTTPGINISGENHVYGYRNMTVAAALPTTGTPSFPANTTINFTTSIPTACSGAPGIAQLFITVERLE